MCWHFFPSDAYAQEALKYFHQLSSHKVQGWPRGQAMLSEVTVSPTGVTLIPLTSGLANMTPMESLHVRRKACATLATSSCRSRAPLHTCATLWWKPCEYTLINRPAPTRIESMVMDYSKKEAVYTLRVPIHSLSRELSMRLCGASSGFSRPQCCNL
jgi:hypothetical protein